MYIVISIYKVILYKISVITLAGGHSMYLNFITETLSLKLKDLKRNEGVRMP